MSTNRLKALNLAAFTLHTTLGVGIAAWAFTSYNSENAISTRLYSTLPLGDVNEETHVATTKIHVLENQGQQNWLPVILVLAFVFWTAAFHLLYFLLAKHTNVYDDMITKGNNYLRWIEYGVSATIMLALIFYVTSVTQFDVVILSLICFPAIMLLGNVVERCISRGDKSTATMVSLGAWIVFSGIWVVLTRNFVELFKKNSDIPDFVPAVFATMLVFYCTFGIVQLIHLFKKKTNYESVEFSYTILSFVAKASLAVLIASGLAGRNGIETVIVK
jgi:hypothetical protein